MEDNKFANVVVSQRDDAIRLDRWFKRNYPSVPHMAVIKALKTGAIRVNGKRSKIGFRVEQGMVIKVPVFKDKQIERVPREFVQPKDIDKSFINEVKKSIIFQDSDIIVINKPASIAVQGGSKVKQSIDDVLPHLVAKTSDTPKLVHRLDKDTSGILLIARNAKIAAEISAQFKSKTTAKKYIAIVVGVPEKLSGKIAAPMKKESGKGGSEKVIISSSGQSAVTEYKVIDSVAGVASLVELYPITGRTHQLRVHMNHIGTPILGDGKYGGARAFIDGLSNKMHLHARSLKVDNYKEFSAELPEHFKKTIYSLGLSL